MQKILINKLEMIHCEFLYIIKLVIPILYTILCTNLYTKILMLILIDFNQLYIYLLYINIYLGYLIIKIIKRHLKLKNKFLIYNFIKNKIKNIKIQ